MSLSKKVRVGMIEYYMIGNEMIVEEHWNPSIISKANQDRIAMDMLKMAQRVRAGNYEGKAKAND